MEAHALKKYVAECIGTAVLVATGCGTAVALGCNGAVADGAYVGTALAFGLAVVAMSYSVGNVSGCHINPAISLAMWIDDRLSVRDLCGYTVAQCIGAIIGCLPMALIEGSGCGFGANALVGDANNPVVISFAVEAILTFVFVFVVLGATEKADNVSVAGLVIGLSLVLVHLVGIHYTGTSVNPARSLGPALFAGGGAMAALPVFIVGPYVGAALAAFCHRYVAGKSE